MSTHKNVNSPPSASDIELAHKGKQVLRKLISDNASSYSIKVIRNDEESKVIQLPAIAITSIRDFKPSLIPCSPVIMRVVAIK